MARVMGVINKNKVFFCFLYLCVVFCARAECGEAPSRGLFVSVIQEPAVLSSREEIRKLIHFSKTSKIETLFVQVYRSNKAWFPSKVSNTEPYQTCLKNVSEDPFALLIREAHAEGIKVHAWLNLLSLSANGQAPILKKYGPEILTRNLKVKKTLEDYKIDNQFFLEPGDLRVRQVLSTVVEEILSAYPELDGIQFDYIRYPDMHPAYGHTKINTDRFKKATGAKTIEEQSQAWKSWKRKQVTYLLKTLVEKARSMRPGIQVSTTGLMPYIRANEEAFQDWRSWVKSGLVDFVTLMCYTRDDAQFQRYLKDGQYRIGDLKKVNIAMGAYKLVDSPEIFLHQYKICEESQNRSCLALHYGSLLENPVLGSVYNKPHRFQGDDG